MKDKVCFDGEWYKHVSGCMTYFDTTQEWYSKLDIDNTEQRTITNGMSEFSVEWQHQISTKGKIIKSKINKIEFQGHTFTKEN